MSALATSIMTISFAPDSGSGRSRTACRPSGRQPELRVEMLLAERHRPQTVAAEPGRLAGLRAAVGERAGIGHGKCAAIELERITDLLDERTRAAGNQERSGVER